jgi:hypothetical protein
VKPIFALAAVVGSLMLTHPGIAAAERQEMLATRALSGAAQPLRGEGRAYHGTVDRQPVGYWTPQLANYDYAAHTSAASGMSTSLTPTSWSPWTQPNFGASMMSTALNSAYFNPASAQAAFASISPFSYDSTYQFLFGSVREVGAITQPSTGVFSFSYTQTVTLNGELPGPVTQVPEGDGWALLLAGIGVLAVARRSRGRARA